MKVKQYIIAVVDDDEDDCEILAAAFRENYDNTAVLAFNRGDDFLDFLKTAPNIPDLVITDLYMPSLSGLEVIGKMKADADLAKIPIVLLSTIKNELAKQEVAAMELVHYFVKPTNVIGYDRLSDTIMNLFFP